ncbi:MAG TPA: hypothetical protein VF508_09965 [Pyrinomonadaceae bacterium]|jgi:hypothetical protein
MSARAAFCGETLPTGFVSAADGCRQIFADTPLKKQIFGGNYVLNPSPLSG